MQKNKLRSGRLPWISLLTAILSAAPLSSHAEPAPEWCGVWGIWGGEQFSAETYPWLKGSLVTTDFQSIAPTRPRRGHLDDYNWDALDDKILTAIRNGQKAMLMIYIGPGGDLYSPERTCTPEWLYTEAGVTRIQTTAGIFPEYTDPDFIREYKYLVDDFAAHLARFDQLHNLPPSQRNKVIGVQVALGKSGDENPWVGELLSPIDFDAYSGGFRSLDQPSPYRDYHREMIVYWAETFRRTAPHIWLLVRPDKNFETFIYENYPETGRKMHHLGQRYQCPDEMHERWVNQRARHAPGYSPEGGFVHRNRIEEMDHGIKGMGYHISGNGPWGRAAPQWNIYWTALWCLHNGGDMWCIEPELFRNDNRSDPKFDGMRPNDFAKSFEFYNRYAGQKTPETAEGCWIAFRDGLDAADEERFPPGATWGPSGNNMERNAKIAEAFEPWGALQEENEKSVGRLFGSVLRRETKLNDVYHLTHRGNYELYLRQINEHCHRYGGGHGWWRVGPPIGQDSQPYGRFARGFDPNVSGMHAIYLDIHDRFFRNQPLAAAYPVTVRVIYWDGGTGTWKLTYDAKSGEKTALTVTNGNTQRWVEKTITLHDAYFGNRGSAGSDIALVNASDEVCLFHMVEVTRASDDSNQSINDLHSQPSLN
jgi:hypothetical protein